MLFAACALIAAVIAQSEPPRTSDLASAAAPPPTAPEASAPSPASSTEAERRLLESAAQSAEASIRIAAAAERAAAAAERAALDLTPVVVERPPPQDMLQSNPPPITAPWSGTVGVGVISLTGNSRTVTFSGTAAVQRKTESWIWTTRANAVYGEGRLPDAPASSVLALAASLQVQGDRRLTARASTYVAGGADADHVKSVEFRGYGESGAGIIWLDLQQQEIQKAFFRTDFGLRYARELRFQYYPTRIELPDVEFLAPRAAISFRYTFNSGVTFQQDAEVLPNLVGESRVLANTLSKISTRLVANVSLGVSFAVRYDSRPAPGKVPTDSALNVSLEASL